MGFSPSKALDMTNLAFAFLILAPFPRVVQPAVAPPQPPLEPLNTLYRILDSMVKVIWWFMKWWQLSKLYQVLWQCHHMLLMDAWLVTSLASNHFYKGDGGTEVKSAIETVSQNQKLHLPTWPRSSLSIVLSKYFFWKNMCHCRSGYITGERLGKPISKCKKYSQFSSMSWHLDGLATVL